MCRLACKIIMDLKRVRHKHIALAERQHSQTLPGLDIRVPSLHTCTGADWVKRCSSSQSLAQEHELLDSGIPAEDYDSSSVSKRRRGALGAVISHSAMKVDAAHIANSNLEGVVTAPGLRFNTALIDCALDGVVATLGMPDDDAHISNCGAEALNKAEATSETPNLRVIAPHVVQHRGEALGEGTAIPRVSDSKFETAAVCRDECANNDLSNSRNFATIHDFLTESWDEDLEDAIIRCSDASILESRFENAGMANHKVEPVVGAAMPDMRCEPSHMAKCRDDVFDVGVRANHLDGDLRFISTQSTKIKVEDVDGAIPNFFNVIEASRVSKLVVPNTTVESSPNASHLTSHLQEDFATDYYTMDNECSLLSHPDDIPLKFSQQQMDVLEAVACGKSVFITGSAGTGKSFLLMYIIRMLKNAVGKGSVYVTASTGLAACALNGTTLHSFAGIGLGGGTPECIAGRVLRKKESRKRWKAAQVLVIDEISMIDGELFDKLEYVARIVRETTNCFGGIQLIVTGDFFQLPPVNPPNRRKYFAFQSDCWNSCFDLQVELEHVFRQSDSTFIKMLNEIRKGLHSPETLKNLSMCYRALPDDGTEIAPTRLYPLKVDVRLENMQELKALETNIITFHSVDSVPNRLHRYMLDGMRAEKELQLCVGAQVMLIKNIDTCGGLVNGAKGVVVGFQSTYNALVDEKDEERKHLKSVSHVVSPDNLWPVVRFGCGVRTIGPKKESAEDGGVEVVSRIQVPLILAWALSVHKCQGMTLNKVQTDLSKAFDFGMVYVALSRVKDLDGLQLVGFDPTRIKVHPDVVTFDKLIEKV